MPAAASATSKPKEQILAKIIVGIPRVVSAMENLSIEQLWPALKAVESSYKSTLREAGLPESVCDEVSEAIMRRVKGQIAGDDLTELEIMHQLSHELRSLDVPGY